MRQSTSRKRITDSQQFNDVEPGSILTDFRTLLEFIGTEGLVTRGKYHQLPQECLFRLDQLMTKPLRPKLQRPQLRSFPALLGLYVLARGMGLVRCMRGKKGGRISIDAELRSRWESLNPTEQYFNLLEAWFRLATFEVVGEESNCDMPTFQICYRLNSQPRKETDGTTALALYGLQLQCAFAVMELFGLVEVVQSNTEHVGEVHARATDFGSVFFGILLDAHRIPTRSFDEVEFDPELGSWQKSFVNRFPAWQRNLEYPQREFRDGVFVFNVSLGSTWRRIEIPANCVLQDLADCILTAYQFDDDHLYAFGVRDRRGVQHEVLDPRAEKEISAADFSIGFLPLSEGETMPFLFDFGYQWQFDVKLEQIGPPNARLKKARITAKKGKSPPQYSYDEDDF